MAKKRGVLAGAVRVVPSSIHWEGHLIEVDEAWLQQRLDRSFDYYQRYIAPPRYILFFTLKVDGQLPGDFHCPDWGASLIFKEDGTEYTYWIQKSLCINGFEGIKAYFGDLRAKTGWISVYGAPLGDKMPKSIRLRAGRTSSRWELGIENHTAVLSEEVFTFELPSYE